jgi:prepilin-type N-terminal cleavage/methylation domain-containing protein
MMRRDEEPAVVKATKEEDWIPAPRGSVAVRRGASAQGFTLIELLVVIGIIALLAAMFIIGLNHVTAGNKVKSTRTSLETLKTLLTNYQEATHFGKLPPNQTNAAYVAAPSLYWTTGTEIAAGYTGSTQLTDTQNVMLMLESLPENKTLLANLPNGTTTSVTVSGVSVIMVNDAWGNPILFVPGGGLQDVYVNQQLSTILASRREIGTATGTVAAGDSDQPFFVSGGPDGDISNSTVKDDDNLYSFE